MNKDPFVGDGVQQVYSIDTEQVAALTKAPLAGSYLQLVDGQPGGLGVVGVPQLDAGPFLSYGIQWIAFGILAPIGLGYFAYSEIRARRQEKQHGGRPPPKPRRTRSARIRRRRSPWRPNSPTATAAGGNPTGTPTVRPAPRRPPAPARDSVTARRRSATVGSRPSPSVGRICSSWRYWVGPPRRTPSAPAKAASTTPALGLGWRAASRRQARAAPDGDPPTSGAQQHHQRRGHPRAATKLATSSNLAAAQPKRR